MASFEEIRFKHYFPLSDYIEYCYIDDKEKSFEENKLHNDTGTFRNVGYNQDKHKWYKGRKCNNYQIGFKDNDDEIDARHFKKNYRKGGVNKKYKPRLKSQNTVKMVSFCQNVSNKQSLSSQKTVCIKNLKSQKTVQMTDLEAQKTVQMRDAQSIETFNVKLKDSNSIHMKTIEKGYVNENGEIIPYNNFFNTNKFNLSPRLSLIKQAKSILRKKRSNCKIISPGDNVSIPLSKVGKSPYDPRQLQGVVLKCNNQGIKIGTPVGILKGFYNKGDVHVLKTKFIETHEIPQSTVTIRQALKIMAGDITV